jgi:hypothetical protein
MESGQVNQNCISRHQIYRYWSTFTKCMVTSIEWYAYFESSAMRKSEAVHNRIDEAAIRINQEKTCTKVRGATANNENGRGYISATLQARWHLAPGNYCFCLVNSVKNSDDRN